MKYQFPVDTIGRLNNMDVLQQDYKYYLPILPDDDLAELPQRYRVLIVSLYGDKAEDAWERLRALIGRKLARNPYNGVVADMAWLVGLRDNGGQRLSAAQDWQRTLRGGHVLRRL